MGLQTIRQKLTDVLKDDADVMAFFKAIVQNRPLQPNEEDGISIYKRRNTEAYDEFGGDIVNKKMVFRFDIICVMVRGNGEDGDEAQMEAYKLVCDCLTKNRTLDCLVDRVDITGARWDEDARRGEVFYTTIAIDITAYLDARDR